MSQTVHITITPDLERALKILRQSSFGSLNTAELIKMAVNSFAKIKIAEMTPAQQDALSSQLFYSWSRDDDTLNINNIAHPEKLKPFTPKPYVRTS